MRNPSHDDVWLMGALSEMESPWLDILADHHKHQNRWFRRAWRGLRRHLATVGREW